MIQSRNNVYGPYPKGPILKNNQDKDFGHMGFNGFAHQPTTVKIVEDIYESCMAVETRPELNCEATGQSFHDLTNSKMLIYGEWAGKGIMKNVAISEFEKGFYIFGIRLVPSVLTDDPSTDTSVTQEDDGDEYRDDDMSNNEVWIDIAKIKLPANAKDARIFNLIDFQHWELDIDFNCPVAVQNQLVDITNQVEKVCPVGLALGKSDCGLFDQNKPDCSLRSQTGEGVVWQTEWRGYRLLFKVKGTKHSVSKVKTIASVDPEEHASIQEFLEYAVTDNRIDQALHEVEQAKGTSLRTSDIGDLLKWIMKDISKEESDVIKKSNLDWAKVSKHVATKARTLFLAKLS